MAQSAKLFVFEERADVTIEQTRSIPIELARTGRVGLTQTEISKLIGRLFIERTAVNLHSELLDAPEFLWEDDQWEPLYKQIYTRVPRARARSPAVSRRGARHRRYLDIPARVSLLNRRIDIMRELLDVLQTQMGNDHASKVCVRESRGRALSSLGNVVGSPRSICA